MTFFPHDFGRGSTLFVGALLRALIADAEAKSAFRNHGKDSKEFRKYDRAARKANESLGFWTLLEVDYAITADDEYRKEASARRAKAKKPAKAAQTRGKRKAK
jgi:hypothetical protein